MMKTLNALERNPRVVNDTIRRLQRKEAQRTPAVFEYDTNGGNDETVDFQAFINDTNNVSILVPSGTIRLTEQITLRSNLHIHWDNVTIDFDNADVNNVAFLGEGTLAGTGHVLTSNAARGDRYISTAGFASYIRGNYVLLMSDTEFGLDTGYGTEGEILRVADSRSDRLSFDTWLKGKSYTTADDARVYKWTPIENVSFTGDLTIHATQSMGLSTMGSYVNTGVAQTAFRINNGLNIHIEGMHCFDFYNEAIVFVNVVNGRATRNVVDYAIATASNGYGLTAGNACQNVTFDHNKFRNVRHALAAGSYNLGTPWFQGGIYRGLTYLNNHISGSVGEGNAIDAHPNGEGVLVLGNYVESSVKQGILIWCRNALIADNVIDGATEKGIHYFNSTSDATEHLVIANNIIRGVRPHGKQLISTAGNGDWFLPGETATQAGGGAGVGVVESYIDFGDANLYVREVSGNFGTGANTITGLVSGATATTISTEVDFTFCVGIVVHCESSNWCGSVTGNSIYMVGTHASAVGILADECWGVTFTGNSITLPDSATGTGISLVDSSHTMVSGNTIIGFGTASSSTGIADSSGTGNHLRDNIIHNVTTKGGHGPFIGTATYDPSNLADGDGENTTVTVTGAALGDIVDVSFSLNLSGITFTGYVSATDTVSVRFQNERGIATDLGSGTIKAVVYKFA
jgi:hypothetical protein